MYNLEKRFIEKDFKTDYAPNNDEVTSFLHSDRPSLLQIIHMIAC